jgi:hypothetical protein
LAAQLNSIRFKPVEDGTQIILDVSKIPEDLQIQTGSSTIVSAVFSGKLANGLKSQVKRFTTPNLQQVYWEASHGRVQVFIRAKMADATSVYPLSNPNRLIFHVRNNYTKISKSDEIGPGVKHTRLARLTKRGPLLINILEVDPKNQFIEVMPALASDRMMSKARGETIVRRTNAIAGINGSFFKPDRGTPVGLLIIDGELISGPIFDRVAFGITKNQELRMTRVGMRGEINLGNGTHVRLDNVNQPRVLSHQVVVYSSRWGTMAPPVPKNGIQVQLRDGFVTARSTTDSLPIPKDGFVISGPRTPELVALASRQLDSPVNITLYTLPDWSDVKHAIAGGPYLVRNGQVYVDTQAQRFGLKGAAPRSALGITREGKLLLVTVDGRQRNVSVGVSLQEMASIMKQLGAKDAMNLDGGSSTQMIVEGRLVNSPSIAHGAAVNNCLIIRHVDQVTATAQPATPSRSSGSI